MIISPGKGTDLERSRVVNEENRRGAGDEVGRRASLSQDSVVKPPLEWVGPMSICGILI